MYYQTSLCIKKVISFSYNREVVLWCLVFQMHWLDTISKLLLSSSWHIYKGSVNLNFLIARNIKTKQLYCMFILLLLSKEQGNRLGIISIPERWFCFFFFIVLRLCLPKHGHTYFANFLRKQKPTYCISKEQVQLFCEFLKTRWEPSCPWIQAFTSDCLEAADTYEKRVPSWNLLGLKVMSQCSWLSSS